jgi:hypothetical protein
MDKAIVLEAVCREFHFQFAELGRPVAQFISHQSHVGVTRRLRTERGRWRGRIASSANVPRRTASPGPSGFRRFRACGERLAKSQKEQQDEREKVSRLQQAILEVACQMSQGEEDVERAALGVAETKDPTSRGESDIAGLRTPTADGSAKVAGLKPHPSDAVREESGTGACEVERGMRELQG